MKRTLIIFLFSVLLIGCSESSILDKYQWIDLTHAFDSTTLYWPNNPSGFILHEESKGQTPGGYFYASNSLSAPEHGGTHLDAPIHFSGSGKTADRLILTDLIGEAISIDVSDSALNNRNYQITPNDLIKWESINGPIPDNSIVLFYTGYGKFYPDRLTYFGTNQLGSQAIPLLSFPGIHPEAAQWLVQNRKIKAVGLDTPSLDYGKSVDFRTHQILMAENIPGFENLAGLDLIPAKGAVVFAMPMKIKNGSGGPLRIIAGIPN
jgi:kynurenine formamidase